MRCISIAIKLKWMPRKKKKKKTDEGDLPSHIFNIANYLAFYRFIQKKLKWFLNKLKRKSICWLPWRYHWFGIIRNIVLFMSTATKLHTHTREFKLSHIVKRTNKALNQPLESFQWNQLSKIIYNPKRKKTHKITDENPNEIIFDK